MNRRSLTAALKGANEGLDEFLKSPLLKNALKKRAEAEKIGEKIAQQLIAEKQEQERLEGLSEGFKQKDLLEKSGDWVTEKLGDWLGIRGEGYDQLKEDKIKQEALVDAIIKKEKLPKNKESRKLVKDYLFSQLQKPTNAAIPLITAPARSHAKADTKSFSEKNPIINALKSGIVDPVVDFGTQDFTTAQPYKNIAAATVNTPGRLINHAIRLKQAIENALPTKKLRTAALDKIFGEKTANSIEHHLSGESLHKLLTEGQESVNHHFGATPKGQEAVKMVTDAAILPTAKAAKYGGSLLTRILKNAGVGAAEGAGYGALYGEGDLGAVGGGAALGGILRGALGSKKPKAQKMKEEFAQIKGRATFDNPDMIQRRADIMGEGATVPEIVGDVHMINKLKQDPSKGNKSRMQNITDSINEKAKKIRNEVAIEEPSNIYKELGELRNRVKEKSNILYDVAKEGGIGNQGLLDKKTIVKWMNAIHEAMPDVKGLPKMKTAGGAYKDVEKLLQFSPDNPEGFFNFVKNNLDKLPIADDFIKFRSIVRKMYEKSTAENYVGLRNLLAELDRIVETADPTSTLAKADKNFEKNVVPFKQKHIKEAIKTQDSKGKPSINEVFGKQSADNSKVFEMLSTENKKNVLAHFIDKILKKKEISSPESVVKLWEELPQYILETADPQIQKILREIETIAQTRQTLSSVQRVTTPDIGSRIETKGLSKGVKAALYAGSALSGHPTAAAAVLGTELAGKAVNNLRNKAFRNRMSQKNLKYYMKPELLDKAVERKRIRKTTPPYKMFEKDEYN